MTNKHSLTYGEKLRQGVIDFNDKRVIIDQVHNDAMHVVERIKRRTHEVENNLMTVMIECHDIFS
jgi:hypothetical protein